MAVTRGLSVYKTKTTDSKSDCDWVSVAEAGTAGWRIGRSCRINSSRRTNCKVEKCSRHLRHYYNAAVADLRG